jgi:16S rRNA processing protein RimM
MAAPEYAIVGRVRKAHGVRGELVVELITDAPEAIFASGRRVLVGTVTGEPPRAPRTPREAAVPRELTVRSTSPFKGGLIVAFEELADRTQADLFQKRYLLVPVADIAPAGEDEVYFHELLGMSVVLASGEPLGLVDALYELPQGLMIDVRRDAGGTVMLPYRPEVVTEVRIAERVIVVDPPEGLLE